GRSKRLSLLTCSDRLAVHSLFDIRAGNEHSWQPVVWIELDGLLKAINRVIVPSRVEKKLPLEGVAVYGERIEFPSLFRQFERLFMVPHVGIKIREKQLTLGLPRIQIIRSQKMPLSSRPISVVEHRNLTKRNMSFREFIIQLHSFDRGSFRLGHRVGGAGVAC